MEGVRPRNWLAGGKFSGFCRRSGEDQRSIFVTPGAQYITKWRYPQRWITFCASTTGMSIDITYLVGIQVNLQWNQIKVMWGNLKGQLSEETSEEKTITSA